MNLPINSDFYEHPQLALVFNKYKGKVESKIMWALMQYAHPSSVFYNLSPEKRGFSIKTLFLNDASFNFDDYKDIIEEIQDNFLNRVERMLATWSNKLDEREKFIDSLSYSEKTAEFIDRMLKDTPTIVKRYLEIEKEYKQVTDNKTAGDVNESLLEQGLI
jgi:hypothetical protein